jgi:hypothetical protein
LREKSEENPAVLKSGDQFDFLYGIRFKTSPAVNQSSHVLTLETGFAKVYFGVHHNFHHREIFPTFSFTL